MKSVHQFSLVTLTLSLGITGVAISQSLVSEVNIPASYLPAEFDALLSGLGTIGELPLDKVDNLSLENSDQAALEGFNDPGLIGAGDEPANIVISSVQQPPATNLSENELLVNSGSLLESDGLVQVVAGSQITSSVSGNRIEDYATGDRSNVILNSFNNIDVPVTVAQDHSNTSTIIQSIVLQIGIEIPAPATVTR